METFVKTTYGRKADGQSKENYPFWDYRSQRSVSLKPIKFLQSYPDMSDNEDLDADSVTEIYNMDKREEIKEHGTTQNRQDCMKQPLQLVLQCSESEEDTLSSLYLPLLNIIDNHNGVLTFNRRVDLPEFEKCAYTNEILTIPSFGIILFLQENDIVGNERLTTTYKNFKEKPWNLHHSESVLKSHVNSNPYNNMDYYCIDETLPLWSVRQVHTGTEFIRLVQFVSCNTWQDTINLYQLIIGHKADMIKEDFCLFTVYSYQFGLKKLPQTVSPVVSPNVQLKFVVQSIGNLVPLLPNLCEEICDKLWKTKDLDGNVVLLDVCEELCEFSKHQCDKQVTGVTAEVKISSRVEKESRHKELDNKSRLINPEEHTSDIGKKSKISYVNKNYENNFDNAKEPNECEIQIETKLGFVQKSKERFETLLPDQISATNHLSVGVKKESRMILGTHHTYATELPDKSIDELVAKRCSNDETAGFNIDDDSGISSPKLTDCSSIMTNSSSEEESFYAKSKEISTNNYIPDEISTEKKLLCQHGPHTSTKENINFNDWQNFVPPSLHLHISDDEISVDDSGVSLSPTAMESSIWRPPMEIKSWCNSQTDDTSTILSWCHEEEIKKQHRAMIEYYLSKKSQDYVKKPKLPPNETEHNLYENIYDITSQYMNSKKIVNSNEKDEDNILPRTPLNPPCCCFSKEQNVWQVQNNSYEHKEKDSKTPMVNYENVALSENMDQLNEPIIHYTNHANNVPLKSAMKSGKPKAEKPRVSFNLGFFI